MNLTRWQKPELSNWAGFGRLSNLRDELDQLFAAPLAEFARASQLLGWSPALDVHEDKDSFVVKIEVPGMNKEDINVTLQDGALTVSGERKSDQKFEDAEVYRNERFFGRFQRTVNLPAPVAANKIKAQYKDGVLTVTLPKSEEAKPKQISVQVN
jgi:HSP20 family protein